MSELEKKVNRLIVSTYYNNARDVMPWEEGYDNYCKKLIKEMLKDNKKNPTE